ncbi:hypothetical protein ACIRBY_36520 [Streptomyces sp. NPDC096136]|uniref:hypothetical protein n=1 Tax=Streptomyces sp. NPDC096136 TaxID=3366076 RepID=UPI0037FFB98C
MTKLAWAARGISAVTGAVLLGALMAPSAAAGGGADHDPQHKRKSAHSGKAAMQHKQAKHAKQARSEDDRDEHKKKCSTSRDVSVTAPDYINFPAGVTFHVATDRHGHAFLNDSRNPGVWINLGNLPNAPQCVTDADATVTERNPGYLYVDLLGKDGVIHEARCTTSDTPFTPANLAAACGAGFSPLQDTPV